MFGAGFVLGTIRTVWLLPRLGARAAELLEMPVMLVVILMAARLVVRVQSVPSTKSARLAVGCIGLILMLAGEFGLCFVSEASASSNTSPHETQSQARSTT